MWWFLFCLFSRVRADNHAHMVSFLTVCHGPFLNVFFCYGPLSAFLVVVILQRLFLLGQWLCRIEGCYGLTSIHNRWACSGFFPPAF